MHILENEADWIKEIWKKTEEKTAVSSKRMKDSLPHATIGGKYDDKTNDYIYCWTNSFYAGMLWLMYKNTGDDYYKATANIIENKLDKALEGYINLSHDSGFLWLLSAVKNYELTKNEKSRTRALRAACYLSSRFYINGGFIRAWNDDERKGWSIIDTMMNLPLLFWASKEEGKDNFRQVAIAHADKTLQNAIRPDGSVRHIVEYNVNNGEYIREYGGQGYEVGSSWSRGQAWAIYGFTKCYEETGDEKYISTAKSVANYFIASLREQDDFVPRCDFRQPGEPNFLDSSAGAVAASAMTDMYDLIENKAEKEMYLSAAVRILKGIEKRCGLFGNPEHDALIGGVKAAYHRNVEEGSIIYGDYYFMEAVDKLKSRIGGTDNVV